MKVNIAVGSADLPWIAGRFARELVERLPKYGIEAVINGAQADLEYEQIVYGAPTRRPAVGLFTHGDFRPKKFAGDYDGQISLNTVMDGFLREGGASYPVIIEPVVSDDYAVRGAPIVFGVAGRTYSDGRKGEELVAKMVASGYTVIAWGHGWPCRIVGTELRDLRGFYQSLHYYVDTSNDEGGCIPALEAMALGVPVISHTVGVSRPVIAYERGNWESLNTVLVRLTTPRTYENWAEEHATYFKAVVERL